MCHLRRQGFTLLEMMITVGVVAIAAVALTPLIQDETQLRLIAASRVLTSDIELAQVMSISYPNEPVIVKFDDDGQTYWLAYASDPDTPINRADNGDPYIVTFGQDRALSAAGTAFTLTDIPTEALEFNPQGGLMDFTLTPSIALSLDGLAITISVNPTTGTLTETQAEIKQDAK